MAASHNITSLSVGLLIQDLLSSDETVSGMVTRIFPVIAEINAKLPYVCFGRTGTDRELVKGPGSGADMVTVECRCYAATYAQSIELAEAVRACLDHVQATYQSPDANGTLVARSIDLIGSEEAWEDDAFGQSLVFNVRINNE